MYLSSTITISIDSRLSPVINPLQLDKLLCPRRIGVHTYILVTE
jgi:hypothetical protein